MCVYVCVCVAACCICCNNNNKNNKLITIIINNNNNKIIIIIIVIPLFNLAGSRSLDRITRNQNRTKQNLRRSYQGGEESNVRGM